MIENESLGIGTFLEVIVGPLILAVALAYGLYRYRRGPVATTRESTPKGMFVAAIIFLAGFCVMIIAGSIVITRSINSSAETTGSSTRPADPGAPVDQVNREQSTGKRTNAPQGQ